MDSKFIEQMKKRLLREKERLEKELKDIEKGQETTLSEQAGENNYEDSFADVGSTTFERERDYSLGWNVKDLLNQINDALQRIKEGAYGKCPECGKEIDKARLKAIPYTNFCLDCRKKEEGSW